MKPQLETVMEHIEPWALTKALDFASGGESKLVALFRTIELSVFRFKKQNGLPFTWTVCHKSQTFDWNRDGTGPVCSEREHEFEDQGESKPIAFLGNYRLSKISCKDRNRWIFNPIVLFECNIFPQDPEENYQLCNFWEISFRKTKNISLHFRTKRVTTQGTQPIVFDWFFLNRWNDWKQDF